MAEVLLALLVLSALVGIVIFMIRGLVRLVLVVAGFGLMALGLYACAAGFTPPEKASKPKLKAAARATESGWEVTAKGNADPPYRILLDGEEVGKLDGPGTTIVGEYPLDHKQYRPGPVRTIKVVSRKDDVADSVAICAPVVILAARGTNENGKKIQFGHGVGSRAWRTWEYVQTDLGLPQAQDDVIVSAHPAQYPAEAIGATGFYPDSRNIGKRELAGMWFLTEKKCPDSQIVMVGYSQGADVVASVWQSGRGPAVPKNPEGKVMDRQPVKSVVLYADPRFNRTWTDQGVTRPQGVQFQKDGVFGARRQFTGQEIPVVQAWCLTTDPICQRASLTKPWHGDAYDCYEQWAAAQIARDVAPGLRDKGYDVTDPVDPTCTPGFGNGGW